ncbi:MAG: 6-carboxytetrahydropterin synthase [Pseudonocardiaceae bacterium]
MTTAPATPARSGGRYRIGKRYSFAAGHHLPTLPEDHKCARPHGHTYTVEVVLVSATLRGPGFVTDFADLQPFGAYLDQELDHNNLNDVFGFPPTCELLAEHLYGWLLTNVAPQVGGRLDAVRVSESPTSWAEFSREPSS